MFNSADAALRFVFRTLGVPICKMSSVNSMRSPSSSSEMSAHDRHAQAALILSVVEKAVDQTGLAYIMAHYGRELQHGERELDVLNHLVVSVMASMPSGVSSRRGVGKLVRIYFGQPISLVSVRYDMQVRHERVVEFKKIVHDALDRIGNRADGLAHDALLGAGFIVEDVIAREA